LAPTISLLASALSKEIGLIFLLVWLIVALRNRRVGIVSAIGLVAGVSIVYLSLRLPAEHIPRRRVAGSASR
jgi:hypothetical protein